MNSTADRLSAAAAALVDVLAAGHSTLADPKDLLAAGQARDQALACLALAHRYLFAGLGPDRELSASDMLRHPVLGLGAALAHRSVTGVTGPAPTDLALHPPPHPASRAWVAAAAALDAAAVEIARARPDKPQWAWLWMGLPPSTADGIPPPGSPAIAWALAADVAALAGGLAAADRDLADAFGRAGERFTPACQALTDDTLTDLSVTAELTLRLAEAGPLPDDYHLPAAAVGSRPLVLTSSADLLPALARTRDLLLDGPTLTGPQQRGLAAAAGRAALRLSQASAGSGRQALRDLAGAATGFATIWASSDVRSIETGDWAAVRQLRAVTGFVEASLQRPHQSQDAMAVGDIARAAARLPGLLRAATANLRAGLDRGVFLVYDRLLVHDEAAAATAWRPLITHPARRRYLRAADQLDTAADQAAHQLPSLPPAPPARLRSALARDLLRPGGHHPERPTHPALPPSLGRPATRRRPPAR
ncbi:MAG TPA: hypothetical protein VFP72_22085 [Kineosporiaceae bacterium]|nr:hypothetical protein [Kineosporiaceae bacterium]